jgi:hypothetical protein
MNENPSVTITFDPVTWRITDVKFAATSNLEHEKLHEILAEGIRQEGENGPRKN